MAENGVVIMASFFEAIESLPDSDRLQLYDAICRYGLRGEVPELEGISKALFILMKPNIDASQNRYRASKANGAKPPKPGANPRGRPRKNQSENQRKNQTENHDTDIDTDSDKDTNSETDTNSENDSVKRKRFIPPTVEEVSKYCSERKNSINAQRFVDYYQSCGWTQGRGKPIRDWRAAVRTWESREGTGYKQEPRETHIPAFTPPEKRRAPVNFSTDLEEWPPGSGNYRLKGELQ